MPTSSGSRSIVTLMLCGLSLLGAFLLFQVQPVMSKFILPWFGGSPGVWTTCMLFFQVALKLKFERPLDLLYLGIGIALLAAATFIGRRHLIAAKER